jgi:hypothetical protein
MPWGKGSPCRLERGREGHPSDFLVCLLLRKYSLGVFSQSHYSPTQAIIQIRILLSTLSLLNCPFTGISYF